MPPSFHRTPRTWLLYLAFAIFGFVINALGPVTPFLKTELHLSYTVSSLIFSAFAAGVILTGLLGNLLVARLGRARVLWFGLFGMCLGILGLALAQAAWLTLAAAFLTGCVGALLPALVPSSLADEHGELRAVALAENNLIAAVASAAAPLLVGWFSYTWLGWRFGLALPLIAALLLWLLMGRKVRIADGVPLEAVQQRPRRRLPARYWVFWVAIILANAIEYCMVFWCADYLEHVAGLPRAVAAQAVSMFLAGVILGRLAGSRVVQRFSAYQVVSASILLAAAGFALYWLAAAPWMPVVGLFLTGLGVANQFPLILSLALGAAQGNNVQASVRITLASGIAILVLPLVLGRLADAVGIRLAYGLVAVLLAAAFGIIQFTAHSAQPAVA
jgi:fucose permease